MYKTRIKAGFSNCPGTVRLATLYSWDVRDTKIQRDNKDHDNQREKIGRKSEGKKQGVEVVSKKKTARTKKNMHKIKQVNRQNRRINNAAG